MNELKLKRNTTVIKEKNITFHPKISVIIPCYNVENYITECVESILEQTLNEIEIICVNDGSTDDTGVCLTSLAKKDERITVLEQENRGLGETRNQGAMQAVGEYLYFIDSDDWLEKEALQELYEIAEKEQLDVLYFDGVSFFESEHLQQAKTEYEDYYIRKNDYSGLKSGVEMLCQMSGNKEYRHSVCLQLIRADHFKRKELWFLSGVYHEDNCFTFKTMLLATKVRHVSQAYFHRRVRAESVMTVRETFKHAYGYFKNYLKMQQLALETQVESEQEEIVSKVVHNALRNARKIFANLSEQEQEKYLHLPPLERDMFLFYIVQNAKLKRQNKELNQEIKKVKKCFLCRVCSKIRKFIKRK